MDNLERKLGIFTESATGPNDPHVSNSWRKICSLEAEYVTTLYESSSTYFVLQGT